MKFFDELNQVNAAYCRSLGLDATPYETPLSADEVLIAQEHHWLVHRGMSEIKAAVWAPINVRQGVSNAPITIVEYARTAEQKAESMRLFGESLGEYYASCRSRAMRPTFVGD
jgi:hypothetical protein